MEYTNTDYKNILKYNLQSVIRMKKMLCNIALML